MDNQEFTRLFSENEKYIKGRHLVTIFHNEQNFYSVVRVRVEETNEDNKDKEAVITGYFPKIHEQETYTFYGQFKDHPKFGAPISRKTFQKGNAADETRCRHLFIK